MASAYTHKDTTLTDSSMIHQSEMTYENYSFF